MKDFKKFAVYGLSVTQLSNICAVDGILGFFNNNKEGNKSSLGDLVNNAVDLMSGTGLIDENIKNSLKKLTDVILENDKEKGLNLLNENIFNDVNIEKKKLERNKNVFFKYRKKEKDKKQETLFVLFHGLGQSLDDYESDIETLQKKFGADVLLIEYNLNGDKTNTFGDMEKYCNDVAQYIKSLNYNNYIFFGYSLGSFVGDSVRKHFNEINKEKINSKQITSKYIGYKGIYDLDNAGQSFIKTFIGKSVDEKTIFIVLNLLLGVKNITSYSDVFKYLLGEEEFNKIKALTTNALILKNTNGFNKDKVVFDENLVTKSHSIDLKNDITPILNVFNNEENKDKDVFLFQIKGGDEVVGKGMECTYNELIGKKNVEPKKIFNLTKKGTEIKENEQTDPQVLNTEKSKNEEEPNNEESKNGLCCGL